MTIYRKIGKPVLDFMISLVALLILSPILLILSVLLFVANSGSPFFRQNRPGKDGRIFKVIKFKTMNDNKDNQGNLLPDNNRITFIGKFIRKTSLDELPQLFSVLKGDMSIVGPRPLLTEYLPLYNIEQSRRHEVKPGITGWAQVNGRNAITWEKKFELDVYYVDNISLSLDIRILLMTVWKSLSSEGVNSDISNTMPYFTGTK